jgi:hypothetical protein
MFSKPLLALSLAVMAFLTGCSSAEKESTYTISTETGSFDHSHATFTEVLKTHVKGAKVDYSGIKKSPAKLNAYLDTLANIKKSEYDGWSKDQKMAFLINLYNAATLKLIIDHYPVKSIKDIGGIIKGPWKQEVVRLWGKKVTLDHVEHDLLRPGFKDPRVHFAVNCASIGCPDLLNEAFQASKLDDQLDNQARAFLADTKRNRLDAKNKTLYLSSIFDWFEEDFVKKSGSVEKFVAPYFNDADRAVIQRGGLKIKNTEYDWNLNKQ